MHKLILSFKGTILKVYSPSSDSCLIGRAPDSDIVIDNLAVALTHAVIRFHEQRALLSCPGPDHHIQINNKVPDQHTDIRLAHGDEITLGKHTVQYQWDKQRPVHAPVPRNDTGQPHQQNSWIQMMNGPKMGRTVELKQAMLKLGSSTSKVAMITRRQDGYYLCRLDNSETVTVNNLDIGENDIPLQDGSTIRVGDMQLLFFTR